MKTHGVLYRLTLLWLWGACLPYSLFSQERKADSLIRLADREVPAWMRAGNIPGLSLVLIIDGHPYFRNYGFADVEKRTPVTSHTLFELGSCSKAFTALAAARLIGEGRLHPDDPVSKYIPWWQVSYKDTPVTVTIGQLMHHTSGIPWSTISKIPIISGKDALEQTVRQLRGQELNRLPGKKFEYATINYDVLALIIQRVAGQPFEQYVQQQVIDPLRLSRTTIGYPIDQARKAEGYKIGFFKARKYDAPVFGGNNAAGYVNTDAVDMAKWVLFQIGLEDSALYPAARYTQQRDESVPLHGMDSYASGWQVALDGTGEIFHEGTNPNFSSYVVFRPAKKTGVAIVTNSNSSYTPVIGNRLIKLLAGEKIEKEFDPGDNFDKVFSVTSLLLGGYALIVLTFLVLVVLDIIRRRRTYQGYSGSQLRKIGLLLLALLPYAAGLYLAPKAVFGFTWQAMIVWTPASFLLALWLLIFCIGLTCGAYVLSVGFPEKNEYRRMTPKLLLLSILSGLANMLLIILITSSLDSEVKLGYLVFYYLLMLSVYLMGRMFVQVSLINFTMGVIYEIRMRLTDKIFETSYQKFEKIDRGMVYTTMNDDVGTIGDSTSMFVVLVTSIFTATGALLYLASIAFWATLLTFFFIASLSTLYYLIIRSMNKYYEQARDTRNVFMRLLNGMIDGYKELSLRRNKKQGYREDIAASADAFRVKMSVASIKFVKTSLVGEAVLIAILGMVAFAFPKVFPGIQAYTLMSFIIVLLYLTGPVNAIVNSVPGILRLRVAIRRIRQFLRDIPSGADKKGGRVLSASATVDSIRAEGIVFRYDQDDSIRPFTVGPVNLEIGRGEIVFIIGGNGSGKTTLAKLFTGLYQPEEGHFLINGEVVESGWLGEYFSAVFSPVHLFEKLYAIDVEGRSEEVNNYLKLLDLDQKVSVRRNAYTSLRLSGGQRKRLGLLQCYLEDSPIYLFDEWAADQDPSYRLFFYRTLLPEMRKRGKIVIAITHDDHYFDVADRVYRMDGGRLDPYEQTTFETNMSYE
ncbi:MAG TPA: cyclic peptide export ABC transporter [Puia sp.]|nr:cyclic peptide export ABC transporter [Puia sp.]